MTFGQSHSAWPVPHLQSHYPKGMPRQPARDLQTKAFFVDHTFTLTPDTVPSRFVRTPAVSHPTPRVPRLLV